MSFDRRNFLKYFGAGSVVAAVAGEELCHARLIAEPKVEIIKPPSFRPATIKDLRGGFLSGEPATVTIRYGETHDSFVAYLTALSVRSAWDGVIDATIQLRTIEGKPAASRRIL